jgi:hypothetical protein
MPLAGSFKFMGTPVDTKAAAFATPSYNPQLLFEWLIANGTGTGQADLLYTTPAAGLSLAQSANADLDVNGVLFNVYGAAFNLLKLKALAVLNRSTSPGNITVGRGASNGVVWISAVSAGVVIPPGGANLWVAPSAGVAVTASTADLINVASAATVGTYTYDVMIVGCSA